MPATAQQLRIIRDMYEAGNSYQAIGDVLGVSASTISRWMDKGGIPRFPGGFPGARPKRWTEWDLPADKIRELYDTPMTMERVAAELGTTRWIVRRCMQANGIPIRPPGGRYAEPRLAALRQAREDGMTRPQMCQQFGIPARSLDRYLKAAGARPAYQVWRDAAAAATADLAQRIRRLYETPMSVASVARRLRMPASTVQKIMIRHNIPRRPPGERTANPQPPGGPVIRAYARGEAVTSIARRYGISASTVHKKLRQAGVPARGRDHLHISLDENVLIAMARAGASHAEMYLSLGISRSTLSRRLAALQEQGKIPPRQAHGTRRAP